MPLAVEKMHLAMKGGGVHVVFRITMGGLKHKGIDNIRLNICWGVETIDAVKNVVAAVIVSQIQSFY